MKGGRLALDEEIRTVELADRTYADLVDKARALSSSGLLTSSAESRRVTFRKLDAYLRAGLSPLRSRFDEQASRSGKSVAFEACHATLMTERIFGGLARAYRLFTIRVAVRHDEIQVERVPLPAVLRFHAFERLQERSDLSEGFVRALATDCLEWHSAARLADFIGEEDGITRLVVPGPGTDGMALGHFDGSAAVPAGTLHRFGRTGETVEDVCAAPLGPRLQIFDTFIGPAEIRPLQREVRDCWTNWRAHCGRSYDRVLEREIFPGRTLSPALPSDLIDAHSFRAAWTFLRDPRAMMTIQNLRPEEAAELLGLRETDDETVGDVEPAVRFG